LNEAVYVSVRRKTYAGPAYMRSLSSVSVDTITPLNVPVYPEETYKIPDSKADIDAEIEGRPGIRRSTLTRKVEEALIARIGDAVIKITFTTPGGRRSSKLRLVIEAPDEIRIVLTRDGTTDKQGIEPKESELVSRISVFKTEDEMGRAAAKDILEDLISVIERRNLAVVLFA